MESCQVCCVLILILLLYMCPHAHTTTYLCAGRYACDPEVVRAAIEGVAAQTGGAKKA
jgi:hypothetical protein